MSRGSAAGTGPFSVLWGNGVTVNVREKSKPSGLRLKVRLRGQAGGQHHCGTASAAWTTVWIFSTTWQIFPEAATWINVRIHTESQREYKQMKDDNKSRMNLPDITDGNLIGLRKVKWGWCKGRKENARTLHQTSETAACMAPFIYSVLQ